MAIYDKQASSALQATQSSLQSQNPSSQQILKQDSSVYRWVYRPEMQYSVFELDIEPVSGEILFNDYGLAEVQLEGEWRQPDDWSNVYAAINASLNLAVDRAAGTMLTAVDSVNQ